MSHKYIKKSLNLILVIALISVITMTTAPHSFAASFSDIDNHWAKSYIETVATYDAISGYPDGSFKPNSNITRIEFITIMVNSQGINVSSPVKGQYWGEPIIEAALNSGLILNNEYGNMSQSTFDKNISREEMASIVVNAYIKSGGVVDPLVLHRATTRLNDFDSVSPNYYEKVIASVAMDFITGYPEGTFAPKQNASRSEATVVSYRLLQKMGIINSKLPENIIISKDKLKQGDLLKITIHHVSDTSIISLVQDLYPDFKWDESKDFIQGYIPTNYNTSPGVYSLKFTNSETGRKSTKDIQIIPRDFRVQKLKVDSSIEASTKTEAANAEYRKYFNPSRDNSSPVKYYTEPFLIPVKGRLTTEFGESRTVNGAATSYRHSGLDIAAPRGTNVLATNRGKVNFSMPLILTGNSIVIDHGEGLFSVYFHLDKLSVKEGEIVERGQKIGEVGSTGFSTGPHLHFTMSYYKVSIEPGYFLYGESIHS